MSIKTLRKRIALVAVSALGAGLMSVTPAFAGAGDETIIASKGIITAAVGDDGDVADYGVMNSTGNVTLSFEDSGGGDRVIVTVSGGTGEVIPYNDGTIDATGATSTASGKYFYSAVAKALVIKVTPTGAGTNLVIKSFDDADGSGTVDAGETTPVSWLTYKVVLAGLSGVYNAANSRFAINDNDGTPATAYPALDVTGANAVKNGEEGYITVKLYDGLGAALTTDVNTVTATVKSGDCLIAATSGDQVTTTAIAALSSGQGEFFTLQATDDAPTVCVVDVAVDGAVVATKTILHQGKVASVGFTGPATLADAGDGAITGAAYYWAKDSAGNYLGDIDVAYASGYNSVVTALSFSEAGPVTKSAVTTVNGGAAPASTPGTIGFTCSAIKGTASVKIKHTFGTGVSVTSDAITLSCFGDAVNYKASLDKATYMPGEIATLTITATDSAGNKANEEEQIGTDDTADVSITGAYMTPVSAAKNTDKFVDGKKTYKFVVGGTDGSYNLIVDLPKFNSTTYSQSAITVAYSIKSSTSSVTTAEVLAAIVKLIASINEQIALVQKQLKKAKKK